MNIYKNTPFIGRFRECVERAKDMKLQGKALLDVGCSNGLLAHHLLFEKPKSYVGFDPSEKSVT